MTNILETKDKHKYPLLGYHNFILHSSGYVPVYISE